MNQLASLFTTVNSPILLINKNKNAIFFVRILPKTEDKLSIEKEEKSRDKTDIFISRTKMENVLYFMVSYSQLLPG